MYIQLALISHRLNDFGMYIGRTVNVHTKVIDVHGMYMACTWHVHGMYMACRLNVHLMTFLCTFYVHPMYIQCT